MRLIPLPVEQYPLPASPGSLGMALTVLTVLYSAAASLMIAWPLMTLAAETGGVLGARTSLRRLAVLLARRTPGAAVVAIALGIPAYFTLFLLHGWELFPAALQMGWLWLAAPVLLFAGLGCSFWVSLRRRGTEPSTLRPFLPDIVESYILAFRRRGLERPGFMLTAVAAASFLGFGFIMTSFGVLAEHPNLWGPAAPVPHGLLVPFSDPHLARRAIHLFLCALAVGGLVTAWHGADHLAAGEVGYGRSTLKFGALFFAIPIALDLAAGPWLLWAEPAGVLARMSAGHGMTGGLLLWTGVSSGMLAAVLISISVGLRSPRPLVRVGTAFAVYSMVVMTVFRLQVRELRFADIGDGSPLTVVFHQPTMAVASVVILAGISALGWMLLAATPSSGPPEDE